MLKELATYHVEVLKVQHNRRERQIKTWNEVVRSNNKIVKQQKNTAINKDEWRNRTHKADLKHKG